MTPNQSNKLAKAIRDAAVLFAKAGGRWVTAKTVDVRMLIIDIKGLSVTYTPAYLDRGNVLSHLKIQNPEGETLFSIWSCRGEDRVTCFEPGSWTRNFSSLGFN